MKSENQSEKKNPIDIINSSLVIRRLKADTYSKGYWLHCGVSEILRLAHNGSDSDMFVFLSIYHCDSQVARINLSEE